MPAASNCGCADGAANPYLLQAASSPPAWTASRTKRDPGKRLDINMYTDGHTVKDAPKLPLNLLDALREFDKDRSLKAALGEEFSSAYLKLKHPGMELLCVALDRNGSATHTLDMLTVRNAAAMRPRNERMKYSIFSLARAALSRSQELAAHLARCQPKAATTW